MLRLCQLGAHEPPFKEAPSSGPGPRYLSHVLDSRPCPAPTAMWAEREATR